MSWDSDCEHEIEKLLCNDLSEVIAHAVGLIASGAASAALVSVGMGNTATDPRQEIDLGERLLVAAIDQLRGKRQ